MSDNIIKLICASKDPQISKHLRLGFADIKGDIFESSHAEEILEYCSQWKNFIGLVVIAHEENEFDAFDLRAKMLELTKDIPCIIVTPFITKPIALKTTDYKISKFLKTTAKAEELSEAYKTESADRIEDIIDNWEITQGFIEESQSLTEEMEDLILELEEDPGNTDTIDRICAILHTIKGTGAFLKPDTISKFAHKFEDFLLPIKKQARPMTSHDTSALLAGLDTIKILIEKLENCDTTEQDLESLLIIFKENSENGELTPAKIVQKNTETSQNKKSTLNKAKQNSIKIDIDLLEQFMDLSGRVTITKKMMDKVIQRIFGESARSKNLNTLIELIEELHKVNSSMQNIIDDIRKVPLRSVYKPIGRALSDLRRQLKKDIDFETIGESLLVDTVIADVLSNSLIHIIRNCVDHGIESKEERIATGKSEIGKLKLESWATHEETIVELSDDGRGIHVDKIKKKVIENNLYSEEQVNHMTDSQLRMMILHPGFSTAAEVTDVSGRGVGMDMVKKSVEEKGGKIEIESQEGVGSKFRITLPIPRSVTVINGLMITLNSDVFFIPRHKLSKLLIIDSIDQTQEFERLKSSGTITFENKLIPVVHLVHFLNPKLTPEAALSFRDINTLQIPIVIVESNGQQLGLLVDSVGDFEDLIVKFIPSSAKTSGIFSGVTFLDDIQLSLIIDVDFISKDLNLFQNKNNDDILFNEQKTLNSDDTTSLISNNSDRLALIFKSMDKSYALPIQSVLRLGRIKKDQVTLLSSNSQVIIWEGKSVELFTFYHLFPSLPKDLDFIEKNSSDSSHYNDETHDIILIQEEENTFGLIVDEISDLTPFDQPPDETTYDNRGLSGSIIHKKQIIPVVDSHLLFQNLQTSA